MFPYLLPHLRQGVQLVQVILHSILLNPLLVFLGGLKGGCEGLAEDVGWVHSVDVAEVAGDWVSLGD